MSKYTIQVASKLSGVGVHTLRAWEKRYRAVVPDRNDSGRRMYSDEDVEKLKLLSDLCSLGSTISTIANKELEELKEMLKKFGKIDDVTAEVTFEADPVEVQSSLQSLFLALEFYKLDVISHEIKKLTLTLSPKDFAIKILVPIIQEMSVRAGNGTLSLAQEQALTSILKFHIGHIIYKSYHQKYKKESLLVMATPEGEHQELNIMLASLFCCHYGINFYYLGPNLPSESLSEAVLAMEATTVILGTTITTGLRDGDSFDHYLNSLSKTLKSKAEVWVTGQGHFNLEDFVRQKNFKFVPNYKHLESAIKEIL